MDGEVDAEVIGALSAALGDEGAVEIVQLYLDALEPERARLEEAFARGDAKGIRASAHDLKSTSGTVGATSVAEALSQIERLAAAGDVAAIAPLVPSLAPRLRSVRESLEAWL